jgi:hypothetical protein
VAPAAIGWSASVDARDLLNDDRPGHRHVYSAVIFERPRVRKRHVLAASRRNIPCIPKPCVTRRGVSHVVVVLPCHGCPLRDGQRAGAEGYVYHGDGIGLCRRGALRGGRAGRIAGIFAAAEDT